jgi:hypothetical protein
MESYDPEELTQRASEHQQTISELAADFIQWFLDEDNIGELYPRGEAREELAAEFDTTPQKADKTISSLVGDIVDPVQQIDLEDGKFVGVIEYIVFKDEGAYGYTHFSDRFGERKRVVCAKCVEDKEVDEDIAHATQGEGSSAEGASWDELLNKVTSHYASSHTEPPDGIRPGAILLDGTTISGNTSWHGGNVVAGDGISVSDTTISASSTGGKDVARNAQGQVKFKSAGSGTINTTQTGVGLTTAASIGTFAVHDRAEVSVQGTGNVVLSRDGSQVVSQNSTSFAQVSGTPKASSPQWTASVNFGSLDGPQFQKLTYTNTNTYTSTSTSAATISESFVYTPTGSFSKFYAKFHLENATKDGFNQQGRMYISVDNSSVARSDVNISSTHDVTTTGSFSNSPITFSATVPATPIRFQNSGSCQINNFVVRGYVPQGTATLDVSKNDVVTVE